MNNVILFESVAGTYYVVYNLETEELYDSNGKVIDDVNDILYGMYISYGVNHINKCC